MVEEPRTKQHSIAIAFLVLAMVVSLTGCSLLERFDLGQQQTASDGRVELSEAGITLVFPKDWLLEARPTTDGVGLASVLDPESRAMLVPVVAAIPSHQQG